MISLVVVITASMTRTKAQATHTQPTNPTVKDYQKQQCHHSASNQRHLKWDFLTASLTKGTSNIVPLTRVTVHFTLTRYTSILIDSWLPSLWSIGRVHRLYVSGYITWINQVLKGVEQCHGALRFSSVVNLLHRNIKRRQFRLLRTQREDLGQDWEDVRGAVDYG